MGLELVSDKLVRRADEMKDLDNLAVAGHRAASGECDRRAHRQNHQREEGGG